MKTSEKFWHVEPKWKSEIAPATKKQILLLVLDVLKKVLFFKIDDHENMHLVDCYFSFSQNFDLLAFSMEPVGVLNGIGPNF